MGEFNAVRKSRRTAFVSQNVNTNNATGGSQGKNITEVDPYFGNCIITDS